MFEAHRADKKSMKKGSKSTSVYAPCAGGVWESAWGAIWRPFWGPFGSHVGPQIGKMGVRREVQKQVPKKDVPKSCGTNGTARERGGVGP